MRIKHLLLVICVIVLSGTVVLAQTDKAKYVKRSETPVIDQLRDEVKTKNAEKDSITQAIRDRQEEEGKKNGKIERY